MNFNREQFRFDFEKETVTKSDYYEKSIVYRNIIITYCQLCTG